MMESRGLSIKRTAIDRCLHFRHSLRRTTGKRARGVGMPVSNQGGIDDDKNKLIKEMESTVVALWILISTL